MAILQLEDGTRLTALEAIASELEPLGIHLDHWSVGDDPQLQALLETDSLNDVEKEYVLSALDHYFNDLQHTENYQSRDLIVLHPEVNNLEEMLAKFDKIHTHLDDEVRYIISGEGVFGFVRPEGDQVRLTVQPEEYINVPAGTEHWFYLTTARRIKAVRYFTNTTGWTPHYTGQEVRELNVLQATK